MTDNLPKTELRHNLARAELMHRRTAEHLREERERRRKAEYIANCRRQTVLRFLGSETWKSIDKTPVHYQGDGLVTCRRAMESCQSQRKVVHPSPMAFYWWACAFKYVWRCWSKADPEADMRKAIDCLHKALGELPRCSKPPIVRHYEWAWGRNRREDAPDD